MLLIVVIVIDVAVVLCLLCIRYVVRLCVRVVYIVNGCVGVIAIVADAMLFMRALAVFCGCVLFLRFIMLLVLPSVCGRA